MIEAIVGRRCAVCRSLMGGALGAFTGRWVSVVKPHMCKTCFWAEVVRCNARA